MIVDIDFESMTEFRGTPVIPLPTPDRVILITTLSQAGSQIASAFCPWPVLDRSFLERNVQLNHYCDAYLAQSVVEVVPKKVNKTYGPPRIGKRGKKLKW